MRADRRRLPQRRRRWPDAAAPAAVNASGFPFHSTVHEDGRSWRTKREVRVGGTSVYRLGRRRISSSEREAVEGEGQTNGRGKVDKAHVAGSSPLGLEEKVTSHLRNVDQFHLLTKLICLIRSILDVRLASGFSTAAVSQSP